MLRALLFAVMACAACAAPAPAQEVRVLTASYPEGALWQGERLYFAEMGADRVSFYEDDERGSFFYQEGCGPTAIAPYKDGFVILCHLAARVVAVDAEGRELQHWERDAENIRLMDPNDVTADGRGGVYFSDPGLFARNTRPHGRIMHLSAAGVLRQVAGPLWYPNGVFFDSAHSTLYVDEHMSGRILRYDTQADGSLAHQMTFADINALRRPRRYAEAYPETGPDGVEVGPNGDVYVAIYGEGRVLRLSGEGALLGIITTPSRYTTSIGFGPGGQAAITSVYQHDSAPFRGEVRLYSSLTAVAE
jgi:gluconolactonase